MGQMEIENTYTFSAENVKEIIALHLKTYHGVTVEAKDVKFSIQESQQDNYQEYTPTRLQSAYVTVKQTKSLSRGTDDEI